MVDPGRTELTKAPYRGIKDLQTQKVLRLEVAVAENGKGPQRIVE